MGVGSDLVSSNFKTETFRIDWRDTMNYAASVGDSNEFYFDDTTPAKLIAPPLFAVSLTWKMMNSIQTVLAKKLPPDAIMGMVHSTEHLVFHNPIKPGDTIKLGGGVAAVYPGRVGANIVSELTALNQKGEPVFTEYAGVVLRGTECADEGMGKENLPPVFEIEADAQLDQETTIYISPEAPHVYDGCTDIVFPIHTSKNFAKAVGLPDTIYQGTAMLAHAAKEIVNKYCDGDPTKLKEIACSYKAMVMPGTDVTLTTYKHQASNELVLFEVINQDKKAALAKAFAKVV